MKEIQFKDRKVQIKSVYQWRTYRDIIDGLPDDRFNQELFEELPNEAINLTYTKTFHIIKPTKEIIDSPFGKREKFPPVICIVGLQSSETSAKKLEKFHRFPII